MRHVIRDGGSNASRRSERTRLTALIATFLLLVAGVLVSAPGLMTASASGSTKPTYVNDGDHDGDEDGDDNDGDDGDNDG